MVYVSPKSLSFPRQAIKNATGDINPPYVLLFLQIESIPTQLFLKLVYLYKCTYGNKKDEEGKERKRDISAGVGMSLYLKYQNFDPFREIDENKD